VDDSRQILVSGSADKSVRIWKHSRCVGQPLESHKKTICDVIVIEDLLNEAAEASCGTETPSIVSASADKSIILWVDGQAKRIFEGILLYILMRRQ